MPNDDLDIPDFLRRQKGETKMQQEVPPQVAPTEETYTMQDVPQAEKVPTLQELIDAAHSLSNRIAHDKEVLSKLKKKIQGMIGGI